MPTQLTVKMTATVPDDGVYGKGNSQTCRAATHQNLWDLVRRFHMDLLSCVTRTHVEMGRHKRNDNKRQVEQCEAMLAAYEIDIMLAKQLVASIDITIK